MNGLCSGGGEGGNAHLSADLDESECPCWACVSRLDVGGLQLDILGGGHKLTQVGVRYAAAEGS